MIRGNKKGWKPWKLGVLQCDMANKCEIIWKLCVFDWTTVVGMFSGCIFVSSVSNEYIYFIDTVGN